MDTHIVFTFCVLLFHASQKHVFKSLSSSYSDVFSCTLMIYAAPFRRAACNVSLYADGVIFDSLALHLVPRQQLVPNSFSSNVDFLISSMSIYLLFLLSSNRKSSKLTPQLPNVLLPKSGALSFSFISHLYVKELHSVFHLHDLSFFSLKSSQLRFLNISLHSRAPFFFIINSIPNISFNFSPSASPQATLHPENAFLVQPFCCKDLVHNFSANLTVHPPIALRPSQPGFLPCSTNLNCVCLPFSFGSQMFCNLVPRFAGMY